MYCMYFIFLKYEYACILCTCHTYLLGLHRFERCGGLRGNGHVDFQRCQIAVNGVFSTVKLLPGWTYGPMVSSVVKLYHR